MEELIEVSSPTYGRRLVREIHRILDSKKYVYLAGTQLRIAENRITEACFYGGEFIEVTMASGRRTYIPSAKWEKAFIGGQPERGDEIRRDPQAG
jgi:hypothetical protein